MVGIEEAWNKQEFARFALSSTARTEFLSGSSQILQIPHRHTLFSQWLLGGLVSFMGNDWPTGNPSLFDEITEFDHLPKIMVLVVTSQSATRGFAIHAVLSQALPKAPWGELHSFFCVPQKWNIFSNSIIMIWHKDSPPPPLLLVFFFPLSRLSSGIFSIVSWIHSTNSFSPPLAFFSYKLFLDINTTFQEGEKIAITLKLNSQINQTTTASTINFKYIPVVDKELFPKKAPLRI